MAGVVLIHSSGAIVGHADHDTRTWILGTILNRSASWAVPLFVMVSGALLLRPVEGQSPGAFFRRRLARIGIPLVVAHVGYFALRAVRGDVLTPELIVHDLLETRVYTQLYFFWIILGLYVVTPLLRAFIGAHSRRDTMLLGAGALALAIAVTIGARFLGATGTPISPWQPPMLTLWIPYIGYFVLGYALADLRPSPAAVGAAVVGFVGGNAVTAWEFMAATDPVSSTVLGGGYLGLPVAIATVSAFVVGRAVFGPDTRWAIPPSSTRARTLGDLTLGVFIIHMAILRVFWSFVPGFGFNLNAQSLPRTLALWLIVVTLSFAVSWVIGRIPVVRRSIGL
jgi:surface polysaccharide O-acyltransferase-like enzyme